MVACICVVVAGVIVRSVDHCELGSVLLAELGSSGHVGGCSGDIVMYSVLNGSSGGNRDGRGPMRVVVVVVLVVILVLVLVLCQAHRLGSFFFFDEKKKGGKETKQCWSRG